MDSELEDCIRTRVPNVSNSKIKEVLKKLQDLGINDLDDLELVTEEDLKPTLTVIQARKLLSNFARKRNTETGGIEVEKLRHDLEIMTLKYKHDEEVRKHEFKMKKLEKIEDDDIQSPAQNRATKKDLQRTAGLGGSFGACGAAVGLGVDGPPGAFIGAGNGSVIGGGAGLRVSRKTKAVAGVDGTGVELEGEVRRVEVGMCYLCKQSLRIGKINGPLVCTKCKTGCHRQEKCSGVSPAKLQNNWTCNNCRY